MIEPDSALMENYGVLVGRTLIDTSNWSAEVLVINPGSNVVVLSSFSCVGDVVQVSVVYCCADTVNSTGGYTTWDSSPTPRGNRDRVSFLTGGGWSCSANGYSPQVQSCLYGSG